MNRQCFTVAEVNELLPRIRRAADLVRRGSRRMHKLSESLYADGQPAVDTLVDERYMTGLQEVMEGVGVIDGLGGEIKDLSQGLVDFPSLYQGRQVLLCWMPGEERFEYWHDPEAGFSGRSLIEDESEFEGEPAQDMRLEADIDADDTDLA